MNGGTANQREIMNQAGAQTADLSHISTNSNLFDYKRNLLKTLSKFGAAHTIAIA